jgi:hypothetical protein
MKRLVELWTLSIGGVDTQVDWDSRRAIKYAIRKLWPELADALDELAKDMVVNDRVNDYNEFKIRDANGGERWKKGL